MNEDKESDRKSNENSSPEAKVTLLPEDYMGMALAEARQAALIGEVPIGAVVVDAAGRVIGRGHNLREVNGDVTAHAELMAIREAERETGSWRLEGCELFVTLEPCFMCASAIQQSLIRKVWYGAKDPKAGAVESKARFYEENLLNHAVDTQGGVLEEACSWLLKDFFRSLRKRNRLDNQRFGGRGSRGQAARQFRLEKPGHLLSSSGGENPDNDLD